MARQWSVKQLQAALRDKAGNVTAVARELGVARSTIYRRVAKSPALQETLTDAREELVDIAESALRREVLAGNITAIIFTLKTQGKERGYVERYEQTVRGDQQVAIQITRVDGRGN